MFGLLIEDAKRWGKIMSLGASRVRQSFNPSSDSMVDEIKRHTAELIDLCHEHSEKAADSEEKRLWALAMTHYEDAAMWAVKATTTPKK
jgi:hypothetical protein